MAKQNWICRNCKIRFPSIPTLLEHYKDFHGLKLAEEQE